MFRWCRAIDEPASTSALRRSSTHTVSGTLVGPAGPLAKSQVYLVPTYATGTPLEKTHFAAMAITDSRGGFKFSSVAAGQRSSRGHGSGHRGRHSTHSQRASRCWGEAEVRVEDAGATDVELNLRPGATVSGRFEFHGSAATPRMSLLQTSLGQAFEPTWPLAFGNRPAAVVESDGTFLTEALPPGRYFLRLPNQFSVPGWFFESATLEGRNLAVHPLELNGAPVTDVVITLTDRHTELSGSVRDTRGEPDPSASVIVFPAEYQEWLRHQMNPLAARVVGCLAVRDLLHRRPASRCLPRRRDDATSRHPCGGARDNPIARSGRIAHQPAAWRQHGAGSEDATMTRTMKLTVCVLCLASSTLAAQSPPPAAGAPQVSRAAVIAGRVLDERANR